MEEAGDLTSWRANWDVDTMPLLGSSARLGRSVCRLSGNGQSVFIP
jgi:hypothetical protein